MMCLEHLNRSTFSLVPALVAVFLLSGHPVMAARISGDEGTTSIAPAGPPTQPGDRPADRVPPRALPQAELLKRGRPPTPPPPAPAKASDVAPDKGGDRRVTIDFDNVDITLFIKFISELTGRNFVVDRAVKGAVTVISPTKITEAEAYKVFESVLEVNGYAAVPSGSVIKVVPAVQAKGKAVETRLRPVGEDSDDKVVTQIVPLAYANPDELQKLFTPLISKSSVIVSYPPTRTLIVTDVLSNIQRLLRIVREVDLQGVGEEISVIPLRYASAKELSKSLGTIFHGKSDVPGKGVEGAPVIKIVPDERTNALVLYAAEQDADRIRRLVHLLDREIPRGTGNIHVYYLQHAKADDLAGVLSSLTLRDREKARPGKTPPVSEDVLIVADKATNSLVITAARDDYQALEEVIQKLDIPRQMVYIEALIMEVSVNKEFNLGVEWQFAEGSTFGAFTSGQGNAPTVDPITGTVALPLGMALGVLGDSITIGGLSFPNLSAVVRAYKKDSDVFIRATPQLLTTDNEEAEIRVGKNVPYLVRQETTAAQIDYSNYEYRDVGVILNILPQINQERFVVLRIAQELTQVIKEESTEGLPTTLKRSARTTVAVQDGQTVVIGGLIDQTMDQGEVRVPILGDIPLLGWLFRSKSSQKGRTNLFIFLTPHIVGSSGQAAAVLQRKKEYMDTVEGGVIKMYGRENGGGNGK